jgi:hypothetical protein
MKGAPIAARTNWAPAAAAPVKYVATYPALRPVVSTTDKPSVTTTANYPQMAVAAAESSSTKPTVASETSCPDGSRYGHDQNYHWLIGTLDYSQIQEAWVLRYASWEEEDRYGGCVSLVASRRGIAFKRGQTVRVEGALIDPNSQQLRPAYEVRKIRVVGS